MQAGQRERSMPLCSELKTPLGTRVIGFLRRALGEDMGGGDLTSIALVPANRRMRAVIVSRSRCIVSGGEIASAVFRLADRSAACRILVPDGSAAEAGATIMVIEGRARGILAAERTALNVFQRLCGIATLTARFAQAVAPYGTAILDTRKTTPNMRSLEKYAVLCGGGRNHRMGLFDMILIKDNHRRLWGRKSLAAAVRRARALFPGVPIEVEVESEAQCRDALRARPEWILLDNMRPELMKKCVRLCAQICRVEASGGISLGTIARVAATGVDAISIGALTHSAPAADLSLEVAD